MHSLLFKLLLTVGLTTASVTGPLTQDFQTWLSSNGYGSDDFVKDAHKSYGGKQNPEENVTHIPVIFIHGNSDAALSGNGGIASGWDNTIQYFLDKGYTTAELYAISWGDTLELNAQTRTHNCKDLTRLRRFFQAVQKYTGAPQVSFITHSMGVTLARKIIKGGQVTGSDGNCDLGTPLNRLVDTFLGISGGNYGLCACQGIEATFAATCNKQNGYWPGDSCGGSLLTMCGFASSPCTSQITYSKYLTDLNNDLTKEGTYVFSAWSHDDDLIMYHTLVWGIETALIPRSDASHEYVLLTHMQTKELTAADQYNFVVNHQAPSK